MKGAGDDLASLGADDVRRIEQLLKRLVTDAHTRCALLVDRAGRLLSRVGQVEDLDETTFASLASAGFAASDQLAVLLGEDEFSSLYHHGAQRSMFLADIDGTAILAVLFDTRTTLGMVRIRTKPLIPLLTESLRRITRGGPSGSVIQMDSSWAAEAETEIDRLFKE
jgi:predicted regulator of Ras-like GTPase activity (Roadblock/LC7/MglB family)